MAEETYKEMTPEEKKEKAELFIKEVEESYPEHLHAALSDAAYTFSELGLWKIDDLTIKEVDEAIRIWAVVQSIWKHGSMPKELRM